MYIPKPFAETDRDTLHDLIDAHAFGLLLTVEGGAPVGSHIPFVLDRAAGENGTLQAHLARACDARGCLGSAADDQKRPCESSTHPKCRPPFTPSVCPVM